MTPGPAEKRSFRRASPGIARIVSTSLFVAVLLACALTSSCSIIRPTTVDTPGTLPPLVMQEDEPVTPPKIPPDSPLSLEEALAIALANNPDVVGVGWDVKAARARKKQASAGHWPALEISAAYRHHWHKERLVPARGQITSASFSNDIFYGDAILTVPIISGGSVMSSVAASDLLARAAEKRLARTREELVFNVKSTFFAILGQQKLIEAIESSREVLTEHLGKTEQLIEARKAARVDLLNIEVRLAEINHGLVKQRGGLKLHERLLLSLLGLETMPAEGLSIEGKLAPDDTTRDPEQLLAAAIESRPDIAELNLEIEAQARRIDMVKAEYWPVVSAKGTYGSRLSAQGEYNDLGFIGLELSVPIFTGLSTPARVEEEQAKLRSLQQRKRKLLLDVRREVDSAIIQVETAMAEVAATEKSIAMAEESLRITRDKASLGHGTAMDVLDAQSALLGAETVYFAALAELHTALALLEFAAGGAS